MKKIVLFGFIAAGTFFVGSCGSKGQQKTAQDGVEMIVADEEKEKTVYGTCGDGSAMNSLQLITDSGDTLMLSIEEAKGRDKVFGGLLSGDRMAAVVNKDRTVASLVINESTLLGNWIMPNPIDGSSIVGIKIKEGGIAESIEQSYIVYKTWKISGGKLVLTSVREGGGDVEETVAYELVSLGADSLIYKDDEDSYEYGRQR
jgi:hypothetical protein